MKVGSEKELWNKLIKEVKQNRVAGPYDQVPFQHFIQSPIGLVPKAGNSGKTRLIFHLSFDFGELDQDKSLNFHTPKEICTVKYRDLDHAIENCLNVKKEAEAKGCDSADVDVTPGQQTPGKIVFHEDVSNERPIYLGKTNVQSAFHLIPLSMVCSPWLIMAARNPEHLSKLEGDFILH